MEYFMDLTHDQLADMYYRMWLIRIFDENARRLFMENKLRGKIGSAAGRESG